MNEAMFIDFNTRLLIIGALLAIVIILFGIALDRDSSRKRVSPKK